MFMVAKMNGEKVASFDARGKDYLKRIILKRVGLPVATMFL